VPAPLYKSTTISDPENKIITLLSSMPATADYISRTTGEKPTTILSLLSTLEIRGLIKRGSDGSYIRM
jgi:predicted Rossmann fold nucleotide-binding protein DprA/Smf involved in DNA uptake